jgi:nitroreductase
MIIELLKTRRSVKNYTDEKVPQTIIESILEAGRLSPSGGNEQPLRFGVIIDSEIINQIAEYSYNQNWIKKAAFLVVLCTSNVEKSRGARDIQKVRFPKYADIIDKMHEDVYIRLNAEEHQTKIPGSHMILMALEYGIGSNGISYFDVDKVSELLNLPERCIASEIIAFGYPSDENHQKSKKHFDDIIFCNIFPKSI